MAHALVEGSLRAGTTQPRDWIIAEPNAARRRAFEPLSVPCVDHAGALAPHLAVGTQILLAVKPQSLSDAARDAAPLDLCDRVVITILAGVRTATLRAALGGRCRVVRVMPNLAAKVGQGCSAVALGAGAKAGDEALAVRLFSAVGPVVERIDEELMDAFTAVAGSGPAYVFYLAEAMTRAAVSLGFTAAAADRVVRQTIAGASALLIASRDQSAADLRSAVTSRGGTTEAACRVLDDARMMDAFVRALTAARDRGRELGGP